MVTASWVLGCVGVPSAPLFGALAAGLVVALLMRPAPKLPEPVGDAAFAGVGVFIGLQLHPATMSAIAADWFPILLITLTTLAFGPLFGYFLGRLTTLDQVTASFAMIPGGAAGIIGMSRTLGADDRAVAVIQYVRVLLVVGTLPFLAVTVFGARASNGPHTNHWSLPLSGVLLVVTCGIAGVLLGRLARIPAPELLGPMFVAAILSISGLVWTHAVPTALQQVAFALIGLQVGLRFTVASLRQIGASLPAAVILIVTMMVGTAAVGLALAPLAHVTDLDSYLATTPGGLSAVLALSVGSGANAAFVASVQVLRTFVMLCAAPTLARLIGGRVARRRLEEAAVSGS
jgi:membrane AbrB-like protein